jgi:hypothetical protein
MSNNITNISTSPPEEEVIYNEKLNQIPKTGKYYLVNNELITNKNKSTSIEIFSSPTEEKERRTIANLRKVDDIQQKERMALRIYSQNINSLRPQNMEKWKGTLDRIKHLQCDLVGITETGVNWENRKLKEKFKNVLKKLQRNSSMEVSSIKTDTKKQYIPGGTATIVLGSWQNLIISSVNNSTGLGRWSGIKLRVNEEKTLHYVTAYRVCNQTLSKTNNASTFSQQYMMLKQKGYSEPNPRQLILNDLKDYIKSIPDNDYFIFWMDANESTQDPLSKIQKFTEIYRRMQLGRYLLIQNE